MVRCPAPAQRGFEIHRRSVTFGGPGRLTVNAPKTSTGTTTVTPGPAAVPFAGFLQGLNLSDAQKAKLQDLQKEFAGKFQAAHKKMEDILTDAQKKARATALEEAKKAGKPMREAFQAAQKAVSLTPEQKAKFNEAGKAMGAVYHELHDKVTALLTPEQKKQLESRQKEHHGDGK